MFTIEKYNDNYEKIWDDFILNKSINGTFLHSRRFLNYHPKERFEDCSLLIFNKKNNLAAVIPACKNIGDEKYFFSHKGSTYGGIVIDKKHYNANNLIEIIETFENYLKENNFNKSYLKITPDILCTESPALLEYILYYKNYTQYFELNSYIDFSKYSDSIVSNFSQGKRTNINNCIKERLSYKKINSNSDIKTLHNILSCNLKKYNTKPVHTVEELVDLKEQRIPNNINFYAVYKDNEIIDPILSPI